MKYTLTVETELEEEVKDCLSSVDWRLMVNQVLRDLRQGYKYGNMEWMSGDFREYEIEEVDAWTMCDLIAAHIHEAMTEYGVSVE